MINIDALIDIYVKQANEFITKKVLEKPNSDKKKIKNYVKHIEDVTFDYLHRYYITNFVYDYSEINVYDDDYFNAFIFQIMVVPLYQSLGDTLGYKNGEWEFNRGQIKTDPEFANDMIYEYISLGGINDMSIVNWKSSDDTILYYATCQVLMGPLTSINDFGEKIRESYLKQLPKIADRHPGELTMRSLNIQKFIAWDKLPYDKNALGNGSAMRSGGIGLFYPGKPNRTRLIILAVESSRITHNSAPAILASVTAALFTAYGIERVPVSDWPHKLLKLLQSGKIDDYMKESRPNEYQDYERDKELFVGQWERYVQKRFSGTTPLLDIRIFKHPVARIKYFTENHSKGHLDNPGGGAIDAVIMAYDALLESNGSLEKLVVYAILHHGDSDTVGSIAMSWFGTMYNTPKNYELVGRLFAELEYTEIYQEFYSDETSDGDPIFQRRMIKVYYHDMYLHYARKIAHRI